MSDYALGELLAVVLARRLRDGELGLVTSTSPIAAAGCALAQRRGGWLSWIALPLGALDPRSSRLTPLWDDALIATATAMLDLPAALDAAAWRRSFFDFAVLDAWQVDRFGNVNGVGHTAPDGRRRRAPGVLADSAAAALARRSLLLVAEHTRERFVERLEVRSAVGHHAGGRTRETELGLPGGGPELVISPLGCFDFDPDSKAMRVASLHPGVTLETVREHTGFDLLCSRAPAQTPPPSDDELDKLREAVDADGVLRDARAAAGSAPKR